jgi:hypothetical protein
LIGAGPVVDPAPVDPAAVDQDMPAVPRMVLVVRAARCIPHGPAPVALPAPVDGLPLAPLALVLVRAPDSVRLALAQVAQAVLLRLQGRLRVLRGQLRNSGVDASSIPRRRKAQ